MNNKTIRIKFDGDDVVIDIMAKEGNEVKPIVADPAANQLAKPEVKRQVRQFKKAKAKLAAGEKPGLGRGNRVTQEMIDQINYFRDEEKMTSKQIAQELNIGLATVNRHYRPLSSEREIN